jgi:hypothetical protein
MAQRFHEIRHFRLSSSISLYNVQHATFAQRAALGRLAVLPLPTAEIIACGLVHLQSE